MRVAWKGFSPALYKTFSIESLGPAAIGQRAFVITERVMMVIDTIRHAESEGEIYMLLTAHTERLQALSALPAQLTALPLAGVSDLNARCQALLNELDAASRRLDDSARFAIKETLQIYGAALFRLRVLESKNNSRRRYHAVKEIENGISPSLA